MVELDAEWLTLINEAKAQGLTVEEVREGLQNLNKEGEA